MVVFTRFHVEVIRSHLFPEGRLLQSRGHVQWKYHASRWKGLSIAIDIRLPNENSKIVCFRRVVGDPLGKLFLSCTVEFVKCLKKISLFHHLKKSFAEKNPQNSDVMRSLKANDIWLVGSVVFFQVCLVTNLTVLLEILGKLQFQRGSKVVVFSEF